MPYSKQYPILFIFILLIVSMSPSKLTASTSCAGNFSFLGYSNDWQHAYWEKEIAGECSPAHAVHKYTFNSKTDTLLFWAYQEKSIPQEKLELSKKNYLKQKKILLKNLRKVPPGKEISCIHKVKTPEDAPCKMVLKQKGGTCKLSSPIFIDKERYLSSHISFSKTYYNPMNDHFVIIQNHCNIGSSPCYIEKNHQWNLYQAIAIYNKVGCNSLQ